jgi:hypothetical protein
VAATRVQWEVWLRERTTIANPVEPLSLPPVMVSVNHGDDDGRAYPTHAHYAQAGARLTAVQDFIGHADPRTTRLYDANRGQLDGARAYSVATVLARASAR